MGSVVHNGYTFTDTIPVQGFPVPHGARVTNRTNGYVRIKLYPDDPYAGVVYDGGWVAEHTYVMVLKQGRPLIKGENVHHINGDRADNRAENLELWVRSQPAGQRLAQRAHCPTCTCGD